MTAGETAVAAMVPSSKFIGARLWRATLQLSAYILCDRPSNRRRPWCNWTAIPDDSLPTLIESAEWDSEGTLADKSVPVSGLTPWKIRPPMAANNASAATTSHSDGVRGKYTSKPYSDRA